MTVEDFIGDKAEYDNEALVIWGNRDDKLQHILDVRGFGAIQNLFIHRNGMVDMDKVEAFQDELGKWVADAITEKLQRATRNDITDSNYFEPID